MLYRLSPNRSIHVVARLPGRAEPDAATTLSVDRSYLSRISSSWARIRWSITGMTTIESHRYFCVTSSAGSGSNLRRRTTVEPRSMPSIRCASPQVWNSGATICVRQP